MSIANNSFFTHNSISSLRVHQQMFFMLILELIIVAVTSTGNEAVPMMPVEEVFFDCRLSISEHL
jgi:hypothetical protein